MKIIKLLFVLAFLVSVGASFTKDAGTTFTKSTSNTTPKNVATVNNNNNNNNNVNKNNLNTNVASTNVVNKNNAYNNNANNNVVNKNNNNNNVANNNVNANNNNVNKNNLNNNVASTNVVNKNNANTNNVNNNVVNKNNNNNNNANTNNNVNNNNNVANNNVVNKNNVNTNNNVNNNNNNANTYSKGNTAGSTSTTLTTTTTNSKTLAITGIAHTATSGASGVYTYVVRFATGKLLNGLTILLVFPGTEIISATSLKGLLKATPSGNKLTIFIPGPLSANQKFEYALSIKTTGAFGMPNTAQLTSQVAEDNTQETEIYQIHNTATTTTTTQQNTNTNVKQTTFQAIVRSAQHSFTQQQNVATYTLILSFVQNLDTVEITFNIPTDVQKIATSSNVVYKVESAGKITIAPAQSIQAGQSLKIVVQLLLTQGTFQLPSTVTLKPTANGRRLETESFTFQNDEADELITTTSTSVKHGVNKVDHSYVRNGRIITYVLGFKTTDQLDDLIARIPVDTRRVKSVYTDKQTAIQIINGEVDVRVIQNLQPGSTNCDCQLRIDRRRRLYSP
eukprot:TRINITY_DN4097_c0_g1_i4.p1 TRINITY_DN4097_c0_g1~~TRINITY_DN4097_c0_g1_i4.p1  ORF type:complete len:564 (+),score=187.22 TRINITY_DN4097_c0_g1_i4:180-1871(+)